MASHYVGEVLWFLINSDAFNVHASTKEDLCCLRCCSCVQINTANEQRFPHNTNRKDLQQGGIFHIRARLAAYYKEQAALTRAKREDAQLYQVGRITLGMLGPEDRDHI